MEKTKNVVLYLTHRKSEVVIEQFSSLSKALNHQYKAVFVYHHSDGTIPENVKMLDPFVFTDDILYGLGYDPIVDTLLPGSNHFPLLRFYKNNPEYDYYWVIEDDVRFTGDWQFFFNMTDELANDLITSNVEKYHESPWWYWWKTMVHPEIEIELEDMIKSFNPVYRISKEAVQYIHESLLNKWKRHHEVLFPTLLNREGFSIADFGGSGSFTMPAYKDFFYTSETMKYRPVFLKTGDMLNKLYHPVKDF